MGNISFMMTFEGDLSINRLRMIIFLIGWLFVDVLFNCIFIQFESFFDIIFSNLGFAIFWRIIFCLLFYNNLLLIRLYWILGRLTFQVFYLLLLHIQDRLRNMLDFLLLSLLCFGLELNMLRFLYFFLHLLSNFFVHLLIHHLNLILILFWYFRGDCTLVLVQIVVNFIKLHDSISELFFLVFLLINV